MCNCRHTCVAGLVCNHHQVRAFLYSSFERGLGRMRILLCVALYYQIQKDLQGLSHPAEAQTETSDSKTMVHQSDSTSSSLMSISVENHHTYSLYLINYIIRWQYGCCTLILSTPFSTEEV
jgi:urease accessory protein UreF